MTKKYIYGPGIDQPVAMINVAGPTENWYYYHYDALGSVVALSNDSGTLAESYDYSAFGKTSIFNSNGQLVSTSVIGNPYMFTARRLDEESGLYYYRARMYSADLGRFLQTDPLGYIDSMNLYSYCVNNPVNFVDPMGTWALTFGGSVSTGVGIGHTAGAGFYIGWSKGKGFFWGTYQSYGNGITAGEGTSVTVDVGFSPDAKDECDLAGHSVEVGGSGGNGLGFGGSHSIGLDGGANLTTASAGAIVGGEGHVYNLVTTTQKNGGLY